MTVDFVYRLMNYIINKNQEGNLTSSDFNDIINQAQTSYLTFLLGEFQQYQYRRAQPRINYSMNEITRQRLMPFIYQYNLNIDTTGFSPYPGNYQQTDAMWTLYNYGRIRYTEQDRLWSVNESVITPVATNPIYLIEDVGFRFIPNNTGNAKLSYVRTPNTIIWGFTLDANGLEVYDPATSADPEWYDTDMLEIISRALRMVGVNLQSGDINQYANQITQTGQ